VFCVASARRGAARRFIAGLLLPGTIALGPASGHAAPVKTAMLGNPTSATERGSEKSICPRLIMPAPRLRQETAPSRFPVQAAAFHDFPSEVRARHPNFAAAYRTLRKLTALMHLPSIRDALIIVGTVSTYNPYREGCEEGDSQTASGEHYDPAAWTAAIQSDLRDKFGGVRFGRLYQPAYALVEAETKRIIVRINDVGPLKAGRVLDLNERSMRYFDPFLTRGLLDNAKITLLPGEDWTPGPVGSAHLLDLAGSLD